MKKICVSIESIEKVILLDIVERVACGSFKDLINLRLSSKLFNTVGSEESVYEKVSFADFPLFSWFVRTRNQIDKRACFVNRGQLYRGIVQKRDGSYLFIIKRTVKFLCPADVIPPYIDVDLSELDVNQKLLMGDLRVHPALKLIQPEDHPVVKIAGARVSDQKKSK